MTPKPLTSIMLFVVAPLFFVASPLHAQPTNIRVIDDQGKGVKCELYRIDQARKEFRLGATDEQGQKTLEEKCVSGENLLVKPKNPRYYVNRNTECPLKDSCIIRVTRKDIMGNLQANAAYLEATGEHAKAALVYNEISARSSSFDEKLAQSSIQKVYELAGRLFGIDKPTVYDPRQKKTVISPALGTSIKEFQKANELNETGRIDYLTLRMSAQDNIGTYLFRQIEGKAGPQKQDR